MKLYTFDPAPNPARLHMFMQYKGITLDTVQIDLGAEEQLGKAYRAIVPEATVPALVLDDGVNESGLPFTNVSTQPNPNDQQCSRS